MKLEVKLTLRKKMLLSMISVIALLLVVLTAVSYYFAAESVLKQQKDAMQRMAEHAVRSLDSWFLQAERQSLSFAELPAFRVACRTGSSPQAQALLDSFLVRRTFMKVCFCWIIPEKSLWIPLAEQPWGWIWHKCRLSVRI